MFTIKPALATLTFSFQRGYKKHTASVDFGPGVDIRTPGRE
jgi:hypothetical protein